MKIQKTLWAMLFVTFLSACSIGINEINPIASIVMPSHTRETLYIYISPKIANDFDIKSTGIKTVEIKNYRLSLQKGFKNSFNEHFKKIIFTNTIPEEGLTLSLKKADPKHFKKEAIIITSAISSSISAHEIAFRIKVIASLYSNGREIKQVSAKIVSEETSALRWELESVLEDALKLMFEHIGEQLF